MDYMLGILWPGIGLGIEDNEGKLVWSATLAESCTSDVLYRWVPYFILKYIKCTREIKKILIKLIKDNIDYESELQK